MSFSQHQFSNICEGASTKSLMRAEVNRLPHQAESKEQHLSTEVPAKRL